MIRNARISALSGRDPYELLEVPRDSPLEEIRRSYRRLMIQAHPDRGGDAQLAALLNCALLVLERDREAYDTTYPTARAEAADPWDDLPPDEPDEDDDPWADAETGFRAEPPPPPQPQPAPEPVVPVVVPNPRRHLSPWASPPAVLLYVVGGLLVFAVLTVLGGGTQPRTLPGGVLRFTPSTGTLYGYPSTGLYPTYGTGSASLRSLTARLAGTLPRPSLSLPASLLRLRHDCLLAAGTRSLQCVGSDINGERGDGARDAGPVGGPKARWLAVADGGSHSCAIRTDRSLWCWGSNESGQLGIGSKKDADAPRRVGSALWTAVTAADDHSCGIRSGGTLWCWGDNPGSRFGPDGGGTRPHRLDGRSGWLKVSTSSTVTCAAGPGGRRQCWRGA